MLPGMLPLMHRNGANFNDRQRIKETIISLKLYNPPKLAVCVIAMQTLLNVIMLLGPRSQSFSSGVPCSSWRLPLRHFHIFRGIGFQHGLQSLGVRVAFDPVRLPILRHDDRHAYVPS